MQDSVLCIVLGPREFEYEMNIKYTKRRMSGTNTYQEHANFSAQAKISWTHFTHAKISWITFSACAIFSTYGSHVTHASHAI